MLTQNFQHLADFPRDGAGASILWPAGYMCRKIVMNLLLQQQQKILIFTENVLIFYLLNLLALGVLFLFIFLMELDHAVFRHALCR